MFYIVEVDENYIYTIETRVIEYWNQMYVHVRT